MAAHLGAVGGEKRPAGIQPDRPLSYDDVCAALRHAGRPLRLDFANVHGAARHLSGMLEVTIASRGAIGFSLRSEHGLVTVAEVEDGGAAHAASHGALHTGMQLVSVNGAEVESLATIVPMLSQVGRPVGLCFRSRVMRATPEIAARVDALGDSDLTVVDIIPSGERAPV